MTAVDGLARSLAASHAGIGWAASLPATPLAVDALTMLVGHAPLPVARHSVRVFLLARAYGQARGIGFDEEMLFAAAALHDLGLCPRLQLRGTSFTRRGADLLHVFLLRHGVAPDRARRAATAVRLHMRPVPSWVASPEAGLLQVGAWADVTGLPGLGRRRRELRTVLPARGFVRCFGTALLRVSATPAAARRLIADVFGAGR